MVQNFKKRHKVYGTIILRLFVTESCGFQKTEKKLLSWKKPVSEQGIIIANSLLCCWQVSSSKTVLTATTLGKFVIETRYTRSLVSRVKRNERSNVSTTKTNNRRQSFCTCQKTKDVDHLKQVLNSCWAWSVTWERIDGGIKYDYRRLFFCGGHILRCFFLSMWKKWFWRRLYFLSRTSFKEWGCTG